MAQVKPLPIPDSDTQPFWEGCRKHTLLFQKCLACGFVRWPPSIACPSCYGSETEWITASGKGKIYTFAIYHKAFDRYLYLGETEDEGLLGGTKSEA